MKNVQSPYRVESLMFIFPVPSTQLTESLLNIYHDQRITFENITEVALDPGGGSAALDFRCIQRIGLWTTLDLRTEEILSPIT